MTIEARGKFQLHALKTLSFCINHVIVIVIIIIIIIII